MVEIILFFRYNSLMGKIQKINSSKIQKIKKVQSIPKTTTKKKTHPILQSKLYKETKIDPKLSQHKEVGKKPLTLDDMLKELRFMVKHFTKGITLTNLFEFTDNERLERARKQLKVFFIRSQAKNVFRFIAKSSGLSTPKSYQVEVLWQDVDTMLERGADTKTILMTSRIATQCSCKDFKYRFRYYLTKMGAVLGIKEHQFPKMTNPNTTHKFLCKHQILVLSGIKKPSFYKIFDRYVTNKRIGKKGIRITQKDITSTYLASGKSKIKED